MRQGAVDANVNIGLAKVLGVGRSAALEPVLGPLEFGDARVRDAQLEARQGRNVSVLYNFLLANEKRTISKVASCFLSGLTCRESAESK